MNVTLTLIGSIVKETNPLHILISIEVFTFSGKPKINVTLSFIFKIKENNYSYINTCKIMYLI